MKKPFTLDSWRQPLRQIDEQPAGHLWHALIQGSHPERGAALCGQRPAWRWSRSFRVQKQTALGPEVEVRCTRCNEIHLRRLVGQREALAMAEPELPLPTPTME